MKCNPVRKKKTQMKENKKKTTKKEIKGKEKENRK